MSFIASIGRFGTGLLLSLLVLTNVPGIAHAQNAGQAPAAPATAAASTTASPGAPLPATKLDNPLGTDDVRVVIARFIQMMTGIAGSLAFAVFVWGGFNWVIAAGDEGRIKTGKTAFKYGTIGLIIVFGAYVGIRALFALLGAAA